MADVHPASAGHRLDSFAAILREAMTAHGHSLMSLQRATGIAASTISYYLAGERLPTLQRADILADFLDDGRLSKMVMDSLRRVCARCRRKFYADAHNRKHTIYCGKACRAAVARGYANKKEVAARKIRTARMERAISSYCRWCEPSGICVTVECPLRAVSPLPLVTRRAA